MLRLAPFLFCCFSFTTLACETQHDCVEQSSWQVGLAIGVGAISNPLVDGDAIPLVVLPDIAWYGEAAYFDNGELGYEWQTDSSISFETFISLEGERAFFSFWHPENILFANADLSSQAPIGLPVPDSEDQSPESPRLSIDQVADRDWSFNIGLRAHYHFTSSQWIASAKTDASNTYNGSQFSVAYSHTWLVDDWKLTVLPKLTWKSSALIDYFYGVSARDKVAQEFYYTGTSGWQPSILLQANKKINKQWQWIVKAKIQSLHAGMYNSPLVEETDIRTLFIGAGYQF